MELAKVETNESSARSIVAVVEANQRLEAELAKARNKEKILAEDTYIDALSNIIQRDYYPDLPKLRNHYEYNKARAQGDLTKMREIEQRYKRPRNEDGEVVAAVPDFEETPMPAHKRPRLNDEGGIPATPSSPRRLGEEIVRSTGEKKAFDTTKATEKLRLDTFLSTYTSEDNAAFDQIMEESHERHKAKTWWMQEKTKQQLLLESSSERMALTWPYDPNNNLMNIPNTRYGAVVDSSAPPEIVPENTRIDPTQITQPVEKKSSLEKSGGAEFELIKDTTHEYILASQRRKLDHTRLDLDEIRGISEEKPQSSGPSVGGFGFVSEPSSTPYRGASIVTWGEIEGTPMLLDPSATPLPSSSGKKSKEFKIPATPAREQLGSALADKVVYEQRRKKTSSEKTAATPVRTPQGVMTPRSEAAQRLLAGMSHGKTKAVDQQLRASYTPTHASGTPGRVLATPAGLKTPNTPATTNKKNEKEQGKQEAPKPASLTDDLLNL